jgi:hypothetical protein
MLKPAREFSLPKTAFDAYDGIVVLENLPDPVEVQKSAYPSIPFI